MQAGIIPDRILQKGIKLMHTNNLLSEQNGTEEITLLEPSLKYGSDIMMFRQELIDACDYDCFAGCRNLKNCTTAKEWLKTLDDDKKGIEGVPSDTYLAVRVQDKKIVGIIDLRHHINHPVLGLWGGHMGYSVRPSERKKGYATQMLRLNLQKCRNRNIDKILVTCSRGNIASEKTILSNGGVFEKEILVDGEYIKRYWILL